MYRSLLIPIIVISLALLANIDMIYAENSFSVRWIRYIAVPPLNSLLSICIFSNYVVAIGYVNVKTYHIPTFYPAPDNPYIVFINRYTGRVEKTWIDTSLEGEFIDCVALGDKLYVIGGVGLYVFDKNLNIVKKADVKGLKIFSDGEYIYIDTHSHIEKRSPDLELLNAIHEYDIQGFLSCILETSINSAVGDIWIISVCPGLNITSIAILDRDFSVKKIITYRGDDEYILDAVSSMCFDSNGYAYISGIRSRGSSIMKFDMFGNPVAIHRSSDYSFDFLSLLCDSDRIYGFSGSYITIMDKNLSIIGSITLQNSIVVPRVVADEYTVYVAGDSERRWIVYALNIPYKDKGVIPTQPTVFIAITISILVPVYLAIRQRIRSYP
ncbi:hypothetical protein Igag_0516 [Ignisphaera aggregans DSM 17230]|uniref:Uncharacterized protein n=1 Tax=Ignisphaera aggregans (strain DSM 17230 / JCM 13409 / AQ1.S1) TaxID=583356 RepID=E0SS02_IGNAA|nr:hypothetical protein Igag_0516 [Ignisphaera aggregans DSM 17230]